MSFGNDALSEELVSVLRHWHRHTDSAIEIPAGRTAWLNEAAFERVRACLATVSAADRQALLAEVGAALILSVLACLERYAPFHLEAGSPVLVKPTHQRRVGAGLGDDFMDAARASGLLP